MHPDDKTLEKITLIIAIAVQTTIPDVIAMAADDKTMVKNAFAMIWNFVILWLKQKHQSFKWSNHHQIATTHIRTISKHKSLNSFY